AQHGGGHAEYGTREDDPQADPGQLLLEPLAVCEPLSVVRPAGCHRAPPPEVGHRARCCGAPRTLPATGSGEHRGPALTHLAEAGEEPVERPGQRLGVGRVEPCGADALAASAGRLVVARELLQGAGLVAQRAPDASEEPADVAVRLLGGDALPGGPVG